MTANLSEILEDALKTCHFNTQWYPFSRQIRSLLTDACHEKTDLKVFVVVIVGAPSFYWHDFPEYKLWCQQSQILKGRCHTKRRMGHARPSFFWYDNDKDRKVCFLVTHILCVWFTHTLDSVINSLSAWIIRTQLFLIILYLWATLSTAYTNGLHPADST